MNRINSGNNVHQKKVSKTRISKKERYEKLIAACEPFREAKRETIHTLAGIGRKYKLLRYPILVALVAFIFIYNVILYGCIQLKLREKLARGVALVMTITLVFTGVNVTVFATTEKADEGVQSKGIITAFYSLDESVAEQSLTVGAKENEINFPDTLIVMLEIESEEEQTVAIASGGDAVPEAGTGMEEDVVSGAAETKVSVNEMETSIDVKWKLDTLASTSEIFDSSKEGSRYVYVPVISDKYTLAEGVCLPEIMVTVEGGTDALIQIVLERIATLPDVQEYMEKEPDADNWAENDNAYEKAYAEWMDGLYMYVQEALSIQEAVEELSEEEREQITKEELEKLTAWVEVAGQLSDNEVMLAADGTAVPGVITSDEVWSVQTLAAGTYTINPGVTVTLMGQLTVSDNVTINGGGKLVRGDAGAYFSVSGGNLTLQNIELDGASLSSSNSMIDASNGQVTLADGCRIHHCSKNSSKGAVLQLYGGSAVFGKIVIENCQATSYGGAVCIDSSNLIINGGTYRGNSTTGTSSYGGGFIYNRRSKLEIYGGSFINNTSAGRGGCIYNTGLSGTETYLYGGYFEGNKSTYESGSGAVFYSSQNTAATVINLSGNVQFCGDGVAGSGTDGVFLDLASSAARKAQISSELKYPLALYLKAEEGRVIAEGVNGYTLQKKDMKKITFTDVGASGTVWYAKLDRSNNQVILTQTDPGYQLFVSYDANGGKGSVLDNSEYASGDTVTIQPGTALSREGYMFHNWNTKADGTGTSYQAGDSFQITDDITLYAQWKVAYTVTYNKNNGTIANESNYTSYTYGTGLTLPTPTRTGYIFCGWYENSGFTGDEVTEISTTATGNKTYYAKWDSAGIAIDETSFPDAAFREYISGSEFDKNGDGYLSDTEIADVKTINVANKSISDLKGVELFTELTTLRCESNRLTTLDVSSNTKLTKLYCYYNQLGTLDVSNCTELTTLHCYSNKLSTLDVSGNTALTSLYCHSNQLSALDVSGNMALTTLYCQYNWLTSLDVSNNMALTTLYCQKNQLTSLDVSNTALSNFDCANNEYAVSTCLLDPAAFPEGFDLSKASDWINCRLIDNNKIFYLGGDGGKVTYSYDCGRNQTVVFTLVFSSHDCTRVEATDATCTEDGNIEYYECADCGYKFTKSMPAAETDILDDEDVVIAAINHEYGNWSITTKPTLITAGEAERVCENDSTHKETKELPALNDTHVWTKDDSRHIEPTEEQMGKDVYISEYGEVEVTLPKKEHKHVLVAHKAVAATCTSEGNEVYWMCSGCHRMFSDEAGETEITEIPTIPAGHKYSTKWMSDDIGHWRVCSRCGAEGTKLSHKYDSDRDADCNDCGYRRVISDAVQPTPQPSEPPQLIPQPIPQPTPPTPPTPQPPSSINPPQQSQPTHTSDNQPEDKEEAESTETPKQTEQSSETEKEKLSEEDGKQTISVSVDNGKLTISGDSVTTGNVEGMSAPVTTLKLGNGAVIVTVVCAEQEYTAGVTDTVAVANIVLTPEQLELVKNGETIEIRIDVKDISDKVPEQDREVIEKGIEEYQKEVPGLTLGMYVDISMFIKIGEGDWNAITETGEPIDVIIGIPEKLQEKGRTYYIIRAHDGVHTVMTDMDDAPSTITISTGRFSSYAIAYVEADETDDGAKCGLCHICPTFLGICCFVWLAIIIAAAIIAFILLRRKKEKKTLS